MGERVGRGWMLGAVVLPAAAAFAGGELDEVTAQERGEYLRRAEVWRPVETRSLDLLRGPEGPGSFPFDAEVACDFSETPLSGGTPKFHCDLGEGDVVKVKYGRRNGEVYAETAASRLLWALGFLADRIYPVRVTCRGCPVEPWWWRTEARVSRKRYEIASIERKFRAETIETEEDEGWSFEELGLVDEGAGGAPGAHRDALALLMAFLQNSDTKPANQRLVCLPEGVREEEGGGETCTRPFLMVGDLGVAFGKATFLNTNKNDLEAWAAEPVWRDASRCVANLRRSMTGTLQNPRISEEGRAFLAGLLARLSKEQVAALFTASRVDRRHGEDSRKVADWVSVFEDKRDQVARVRCPR